MSQPQPGDHRSGGGGVTAQTLRDEVPVCTDHPVQGPLPGTPRAVLAPRAATG